MKLQLKHWLEVLQSSYWVIPGGMAILGMLMVPILYLIHSLLPQFLLQLDFFQHLQNMELATARGILATVASAAIGTASVVFSVSIVVLSLTASQFGPRLLKNFLKQGVAQLTLGTFIATFMFSLFGFTLLDSSINDVNLAYLLVTVTILLGAGSFFVLIFYIHHIATFIQAPRVIDDVSRALMARLKMLPQKGTDSGPTERSRSGKDQAAKQTIVHELLTPRSGYVQVIDFDAMLERAVSRDLHIELLIYPGQFVLVSQALANVHHSQSIDDDLLAELLNLVTLGSERTATQDLSFAMDQLVEIAVRALSPGINDPFTAINCIDQLAAGLSLLSDRELPSARLFDEQGVMRICKPRMRYCDLLDAAYGQIREHARRDHAVSCHLVTTLLKLHELPLPDDYRQAVVDQLRLLCDLYGTDSISRLQSELDRDRLQQILEQQ
jgi:uncharacterized membrane protein